MSALADLSSIHVRNSTLRVSVGISLGVAGVLILGTAALAATLTQPEWFLHGDLADSANKLFPTSAQGIFVRNMSSALFLYSGVVTLGCTSAFASVSLGAYFGMFFRLGLNSKGTELAITRVTAYTFFEISGLIFACAAGLLPVVTMVFSDRQEENEGIRGKMRSYSVGMQTSLVLIIVATSLLLVGAVVESLVIKG
jgi:uncharacterized membrane protein SpoIIM required for sporulation